MLKGVSQGLFLYVFHSSNGYKLRNKLLIENFEKHKLPSLPGASQLMKGCASLMWFYGSWSNVAVLRLSVATNAWSSFTSSYLSSQVSHQPLHPAGPPEVHL